MSDTILSEARLHLQNIPLTLVSQGAEAVVFSTPVHPYLPSSIPPKNTHQTQKYIVKYRPHKSYRHPQLDAQLTKHRTLSEARLLQRLCSIESVNCPNLIAVDARAGLIWMEFIGEELNGGQLSSLKNWLWEFNEDKTDAVSSEIEAILKSVGREIGSLHLNDLIHGDLTSSNIVIQKQKAYLIDFGLGSLSTLIEDKAVDLYVLERAMISTHPLYANKYNQWLLDGYSSVYEGKQTQKKLKEVLHRYEDVRMRGRKRSMLG